MVLPSAYPGALTALPEHRHWVYAEWCRRFHDANQGNSDTAADPLKAIRRR
jgi:hypothetical protein